VIDTATLTVRIPKTVFDGLESLAKQTGRDIDDLANEVFAAYLEFQRREISAIAEANADVDGPWVANQYVMRWLESWETPNELPPPL
jgi:predicted transcriptional regulator